MLILEVLIPDDSVPDMELILSVIRAAIAILMLTWILRLHMRHLYDQGFSFRISANFNLKLLVPLLVFTTGYYLLFRSSLGRITDQFPESGFFTEIETRLAQEYEKNKWLALFPHVVLSPFYEEVVVRGAVLRGFLNRYKTTHAILLSGILFGMTHVYLPQVINAVIYGIAISCLYYFTRSLMLCILVHVYHNGLAALLFYSGFSFGWNSFIAGLLLLFISGWLLFRYLITLDGQFRNRDAGKTLQ